MVFVLLYLFNQTFYLCFNFYLRIFILYSQLKLVDYLTLSIPFLKQNFKMLIIKFFINKELSFGYSIGNVNFGLTVTQLDFNKI